MQTKTEKFQHIVNLEKRGKAAMNEQMRNQNSNVCTKNVKCFTFIQKIKGISTHLLSMSMHSN